MGIYAIIIATVLYLFTSLSCLRQKDYPHALIWFSYAVANTGFMWYEIQKKIQNNIDI